MKTVAVIPCYNEAMHLGKVVTEARKYVDLVLVSNGRSTDNSLAVAVDAGAKVILPGADFNHGYGANVKRGLQNAIQAHQADVAVILDADGQHDPASIPGLLAPILSGQADVVMGCRVAGNMPAYRRFGNRVLTAICNAGTNFSPPDAVTGYWAVAVKSLPSLTEQTWGLAVELLIKARANGCRMAAVPVMAIYHKDYNDNSATSPIELGLTLLWYITKWRVKVEVLKEGQ
jgi:glycosyltransferase involved in cell wall biosynthesis